MIKRPLLWAAGNSHLERMVTQNRITRRATHRFVAGERLEDAVVAATQLNPHGIGGILDLLGEGVTDLTGAADSPPPLVSRYLRRVSLRKGKAERSFVPRGPANRRLRAGRALIGSLRRQRRRD